MLRTTGTPTMNNVSLISGSFVKEKQAIFRKFIAKRLRQAFGFTLTEVLATVIIIGLVSGGLAMAVSVGSRQFMRSMALSESQLLFSSLRQDMTNDLRFASLIKKEDSGSVTGYQTLHHADKNKRLYLKALDDNGNIVAPQDGVTGVGQLALCSKDETVKKRLLGKAAYNYALRAQVKSFEFNEDNNRYTIQLIIFQTSSNEKLLDETFTVDALNNVSDQDYES